MRKSQTQRGREREKCFKEKVHINWHRFRNAVLFSINNLLQNGTEIFSFNCFHIACEKFLYLSGEMIFTSELKNIDWQT